MKDAVPKVELYLVERFQATLERSARAGPVEHGDSKKAPPVRMHRKKPAGPPSRTKGPNLHAAEPHRKRPATACVPLFRCIPRNSHADCLHLELPSALATRRSPNPIVWPKHRRHRAARLFSHLRARAATVRRERREGFGSFSKCRRRHDIDAGCPGGTVMHRGETNNDKSERAHNSPARIIHLLFGYDVGKGTGQSKT
jgi:hypothetical protein